MHQNRSRMHITIKQSVLRSEDVWASVDKLMMLAIQSGIAYTRSSHKNAQVTSNVASKLIKNTIHSILMTWMGPPCPLCPVGVMQRMQQANNISFCKRTSSRVKICHRSLSKQVLVILIIWLISLEISSHTFFIKTSGKKLNIIDHKNFSLSCKSLIKREKIILMMFLCTWYLLKVLRNDLDS